MCGGEFRGGGGWVVGKMLLEGKLHGAPGVWVTEFGVMGVRGGWAGMSQSEAGVGVLGVMVVTTNRAFVAEACIPWL